MSPAGSYLGSNTSAVRTPRLGGGGNQSSVFRRPGAVVVPSAGSFNAGEALDDVIARLWRSQRLCRAVFFSPGLPYTTEELRQFLRRMAVPAQTTPVLGRCRRRLKPIGSPLPSYTARRRAHSRRGKARHICQGCSRPRSSVNFAVLIKSNSTSELVSAAMTRSSIGRELAAMPLANGALVG